MLVAGKKSESQTGSGGFHVPFIVLEHGPQHGKVENKECILPKIHLNISVYPGRIICLRQDDEMNK